MAFLQQSRLHHLQLLTVAALFSLAGAGAVYAQKPSDPRQSPELTARKAFQRWWWAYEQRAYPLGNIPEGARQRAFQQRKLATAAQAPAAAAGPGNRWVNIGPAPQDSALFRAEGGRVASIAVNPTNADHWLVGAAQGGIWKTTDGGTTWTPLTDDQVSLAMGAIAFAPSDPSIVYAGTGEAEFSGDAYAGAGLLKSIDGGTTWTLLAAATFAKSAFSDIKVHPADPNTAVAAT